MHIRLSFALLIAVWVMGARPATAASYTVDCGSNGSSDLVQSQLEAIESSPDNTLNVTGTCEGDLYVKAANRLTVSGINLHGNILVIMTRA